MRLTVFGATGRTGIHIVRQALDAGCEVVVLVRNPAKIHMTHERLKVMQGDATDSAAVECAVEGADAVISVLATSAAQKTAKTQPLARAIRNILAAMKKFGVRRLVISSAGVPQPGDMPDLRFKVLMGIVRFLAPASHADTVASVQVVRSSDAEWTIVRMPVPVNAAIMGRVQAGYVKKSIGLRIGRADAAAFILAEVQSAQFIRQAPVIFNR